MFKVRKPLLTFLSIIILLITAFLIRINSPSVSKSLQDDINVAVVNFDAIWGNKEANLTKMLLMIEEAGQNGVNLLVFPELALTGYADQLTEDGEILNILSKDKKMHSELSETLPSSDIHDSSNRIALLCKKYNMYVVYGLAERDLLDSNLLYNSAAVIGPSGLIGSYRKIHLADEEVNWATHGTTPFIFDTPWGSIGISICYDTYSYPELARYYKARGCRLILNPTASSKTYDKDLGETLKWAAYYTNRLEGSASLNSIYIASSNLTGTESPYTNTTIKDTSFPGGSFIVGPDCTYYGEYIGTFYKKATPTVSIEGVFSATLDLSHSETLGEYTLHHFDQKLYASWYEQLEPSLLTPLSSQKPNLATTNFSATLGDKQSNLTKIKQMIETAGNNDVSLLVFPELALTGYSHTLSAESLLTIYKELAEEIPGPTTNEIALLCKEYNLYVAFGLPERDANDHLYNSIVVIGPSGLCGSYRATQLSEKMEQIFTAGTMPLVLNLPFGKVGVSTGYETSYSLELSRYYAGQGCQILLNPSADTLCTQTILEYLSDLNSTYIISSNLIVSPHDLIGLAPFWEGSTIVGPKYGSVDISKHLSQNPHYIDYYGILLKSPLSLMGRYAFYNNINDGVYAEKINLGKATCGSLKELSLTGLTHYVDWYKSLIP